MELTQEYLNQALSTLATKSDLTPLATKTDINVALNQLVSIINETIAEPMKKRFAELKDYVQVKEDIHTLKLEMGRMKEALHLS